MMLCLVVTEIINECKCIPWADLEKEGFDAKGYTLAPYGSIINSVK